MYKKWRATCPARAPYFLIRSDHETIAQVYDSVDNARLIAAAPDMLAALEGARAALVAYGAEGGATFKGVCAAIAKAKGE
jgi:hypothetical protein